MKIEIFNQTKEALETGNFPEIVAAVISGEKKHADQINIILLPRDDLRRMKMDYFHQDSFTDVIAFNLNDPEALELEGEIYLSPEQIKDNALEYQSKFSHELHRVLIHGILHLCGYEDNTPETKQHMHDLEDRYLSLVGIDKS